MNKIKKILFSLIPLLIIFSTVNVNASIREGDKITVTNRSGEWIVKRISPYDPKDGEDANTCTISDPEEPNANKLSKTYEPSFGFTYENICTDVQTKTSSWCSEAHAGLSGKGCDKPENKWVCVGSYGGGGDSSGSVSGAEGTKDGYESSGGGGGGGGSVSCSGNAACAGFIDYYESVTLEIEWDCNWVEYNWGCCSYNKKGNCNYSGYCDGPHYRSESYSAEEDHSGELNDCSPTKESDYKALAKEKGHCPAGRTLSNYFITVNASGEMRRSKGSSSVTYCAKTEPAKVEAYSYKLTINTDLEAYCINPSFGYNQSYAWNTSFDASKCVDSLHSYVLNSTTKEYELQYDMECGYVYILAEAKRINAEVGKEVFNYSIISTAMRLFGTGITAKDNTLPSITDLNTHLQQAGYYAKYYGWGDRNSKGELYEYVGIPKVIPLVNQKAPALYRYFMPEFYSIYLNTAKVVSSYLKYDDNKKIRLSDVGNTVCEDDGKQICALGPDGKTKYIVDADYYLNYKTCLKEFSDCTSEAIDLDYGYDVGSKFPETSLIKENVSEKESDKMKIGQYEEKENAIGNFYESDIGQSSTCKNKSGLGVLCGEKNEKIVGGAYDDNGYPTTSGTLGDSNYLDAIYLYIRALQGNKIVYEKSIEEASAQYTPVKGYTKVIGTDENYITIRSYVGEPVYDSKFIDCDEKTNPEYCKTKLFAFDSNNNLIKEVDRYDYCRKNYCYVKIEYVPTCEVGTKSQNIRVITVTDPNLKSVVIKKISNGIPNEQTLYVYDPTAKIAGNYCQEIEAVIEEVGVPCLCDQKEKCNKVEADTNIKSDNYCSNNYNSYDELYYGDASMSTILNACFDEDKLKYDYTDDLNANGNDLVREGEQSKSKYGYQMKSDDFDVCKLYCRQEARAYLANKTVVRSGMALKYNIGQKLMDKKVINETPSKLLEETDFEKNNYLKYKYGTYEEYVKSKNDVYGEDKYKDGMNFSPIVILEFRECTSEFNYTDWLKLYNEASDTREKNQLIYSAYNCNLYTTADIKDAIKKGDIPDILGITSDNKTFYDSSTLKDNNSFNSIYAEPAMIDYKYYTKAGNGFKAGDTQIVKNWGTTKDYLLAEEQRACESIGLNYEDNQCGTYNVVQYEDDYFNSVYNNTNDTYLKVLGADIKSKLSLVDSNMNKTIYCSGESCYKLLGSDGKYYYNPNPTSKYDCTVVSAHDGKTKSGNILDYSNWGTDYKNYTIGSKKDKHKDDIGYSIPANQYSSFITVSAFEFFNNTVYYSENYSGLIKVNNTNAGKYAVSNLKNSVALDKNVFPLHLEIPSSSELEDKYKIKLENGYSIKSRITGFRTAYERNNYYEKSGYSNDDNINIKVATVPYNFNYICYYDVEDSSIPLTGFTYRMVDLGDVFVSVTDDEASKDSKQIYNDGSNLTRNYPENWSSSFAQNVLSSIETSYNNILEPEGNSNGIDSYLEYSYTLTKEGIKKLRQYNDEAEADGGYLNDTLYDCEYDSDEEIFYNCKSRFLDDTIVKDSAYSGSNLIIDNKTGNNGLLKGESEYCSNNSNEDYCKYQQKGTTTGFVDSESGTESEGK